LEICYRKFAASVGKLQLPASNFFNPWRRWAAAQYTITSSRSR